MNLHDFVELQARVLYKAKALQEHMYGLSDASKTAGLWMEAKSLRDVGDRVWDVADRFIESKYKTITEEM